MVDIRNLDPLRHNDRIVDDSGHPLMQFVRQWNLIVEVSKAAGLLQLTTEELDAFTILLQEAIALIGTRTDTLETDVAALEAEVTESRTDFPGSPATDKKVYRTDLHTEFYYDGTQWLSTALYFMAMSTADVLQGTNSAGNTNRLRAKLPTHFGSGVYLIAGHVATNVASPNDGSKYWTMILYSETVSAATSRGTASTVSEAPATWVDNSMLAINTALGSTVLGMWFEATRVGSTPGGLYVHCTLEYRLIG